VSVNFRWFFQGNGSFGIAFPTNGQRTA
jgi:hypothetical protein